jgi:hypothetical protein
MKKCIGCGEQTWGSVGAAGMRWGNVCQKCKDVADNELLVRIKIQAHMFHALEKMLTQYEKKEEARHGTSNI